MSKKYVIDLPDDAQYILINGASENHCYTRVEQVDDLEELNSDYINEHFGELQDEAYQRGHDDGYEAGCATAFKPVSDAEYQRGFEDGKKSTEKGCDGCKYEWYGDTEDPCWHCRRCYKDKYEPTLHSDRIEVGDEVNWDGDCFIVTKIFQPRNMKEQCDGLDDDGSVYHDILMEDLKKTGKHYDIASILEAMRK